MFVITSRQVYENKRGFKKVGSRPNENGPNELRLLEATKSRGKWKLDVFPDRMNKAMMNEAANLRKKLNLSVS